MQSIQQDRVHFIRIDKDEDLFTALENWAIKSNVKSGHLSGIGALKNVELGFYHLNKKEYERKIFPKEAELLSLEGNLTYLEGKPFFHIHTVLGDEEFRAYGGHLFCATVAVTCEINFREFDLLSERKPNKEIGLNLINFCKI